MIFREKKIREGDLVLTLDAGDWYSGSLYDQLGADDRTNSVPQMEFFHDAGYDGIILGNHDFDRHESALFAMLYKWCVGLQQIVGTLHLLQQRL